MRKSSVEGSRSDSFYPYKIASLATLVVQTGKLQTANRKLQTKLQTYAVSLPCSDRVRLLSPNLRKTI
jgi:hypothetical protein